MNKKIISALFAILLSSTMFSQNYDMVVEYVGGATTNISLSAVSKISFVISSFTCGTSTVSYEGIIYNTVLIGSQCWLKENLNVGTKINGSGDQTNNSILEKYCYDNQEAYCTTHGGLYQWAEAVQYQGGATNAANPTIPFAGYVQGICPPGWHIPSQTELNTLSTSVGGDGNKLKTVGQGSGAGAGTNTSGFSVLLAGIRNVIDGFNPTNYSVLDQYTYILSSSPDDFGITSSATAFVFYYNYDYFAGVGISKVNGISVRCLRD